MVKRNDISAYQRESKGVLNAPTAAPAAPKKRGAKPAVEKRSQKVLLSFTPAEEEKIKEKAGMVPVATFLRAKLEESGILH